ncbi:hypothetical protein [Paenibacillus physcomitrellae]|uniref:Serine protease n=1 Tax=Paenibacillus physcomitrellae TaxID=1619311 RepID=A0ABQ1GKW7_9BACL|nr:hypothetical protein [Paenibacillus physcomitrellae]GGA45572.1 hypothetical protein GCM10010917_33610 [Paenibacillus physcomitrellae]
MADFRAANRLKERLSKQLLKQPGIHGVGVGYRHPGKPGRGAAVIVYTGAFSNTSKNKQNRKSRKPSHTIRYNGKKVTVPIRYVHAKRFRMHSSGAPFQRRIRPVIAGFSVGTELDSGTAGLIVTDKKGSLYILSNNHVLNRDNTAGFSETLQPGGADGGTIKRDKIGRLYRFVKLSSKRPNYLDAALSVPIRRSLLSPRYAKFGVLPGSVTSYKVGDRFKKIGRTTGLVYGTVESINTDVNVSYDGFGGLDVVPFKNQSIIRGSKPVSLAGDSGSVWLTRKNNYAAAVNFAGAEDGLLSISFPVDRALRKFGVQVARPGRKCPGRRKRCSLKPHYLKPLTAKQQTRIRVLKAHKL